MRWRFWRAAPPMPAMDEIKNREVEADQAGAELREALGALKRRLEALDVERGLSVVAHDLSGHKDGD